MPVFPTGNVLRLSNKTTTKEYPLSNAQDRETIGQAVAAGGAGMAGGSGTGVATYAAIPMLGWAVGGAIIAGIGAWGAYKLAMRTKQNLTNLAALASATARSIEYSHHCRQRFS